MALSLGFGIVFATGITLVIVPALYVAIADFRGALLSLRRMLFGHHEAAPAAGREPVSAGD